MSKSNTKLLEELYSQYWKSNDKTIRLEKQIKQLKRKMHIGVVATFE